jgi:hypothetical protein
MNEGQSPSLPMFCCCEKNPSFYPATKQQTKIIGAGNLWRRQPPMLPLMDAVIRPCRARFSAGRLSTTTLGMRWNPNENDNLVDQISRQIMLALTVLNKAHKSPCAGRLAPHTLQPRSTCIDGNARSRFSTFGANVSVLRTEQICRRPKIL